MIPYGPAGIEFSPSLWKRTMVMEERRVETREERRTKDWESQPGLSNNNFNTHSILPWSERPVEQHASFSLNCSRL